MAANRPRPTECPCGNDLGYGAWAQVLNTGMLRWDEATRLPVHHCFECSLLLEGAGGEVQWLPTDEQIQDEIWHDLMDIGIN